MRIQGLRVIYFIMYKWIQNNNNLERIQSPVAFVVFTNVKTF